MAVTGDLLSILSSENLILKGGKDGLNRPMKWVYSILSQPFGDWVNYGDLIFYNPAGRDTSPESLNDAVGEAAHCHLAGIIFLLDEDLLPSLPSSVGETADRLALPVFTLPVTSGINNIQKRILVQILRSERELDRKTSFWSDLLFSEKEPKREELLDLAYHSDINPKMHYFLYLIQFCNLSEYCSYPDRMKQVDRPADILSGFYSRVHSLMSETLLEHWIVDHRESCVVILPADSEMRERSSDKFFVQTARELEDQYQGGRIRISKGSLITDLTQIRKSYREAQRAIYIENLYPEALPFINYSRLGFQRLLYEITDISLLEEYVKDTISPILSYDSENGTDYYNTLLCYYRNFKNISLTARELNYHRNSMIQRIRKIEEILKVDFNSVADFYNIYVALEIQEYLIKVQELTVSSGFEES